MVRCSQLLSMLLIPTRYVYTNRYHSFVCISLDIPGNDRRSCFPICRGRTMGQYGDARVRPMPLVDWQRLNLKYVQYRMLKAPAVQSRTQIAVIDNWSARKID